MKNSERFLNAFITIEDFLREEINADNYVTFYQVIDKATLSNSIVRSYKDDLKEYADLRNAIVHERSGGSIIAEPNDYVVDRIERIATVLEKPPTVIPEFQTKVTTVKSSDSIASALKWNSEGNINIFWTGGAVFPVTGQWIFEGCQPENFECLETAKTFDVPTNPLEMESTCFCSGALCSESN